MNPVVIEGTRERVVTSPSGDTYKIFIAEPRGARPPAGFPALFVLDGSQYFAMATEIVRIQAGALGPVAVVGLGYPGNDPMDGIRRRYWDLTQPTPPEKVEPRDLGLRTGGANAFMDLIETRLIGNLAQELEIDLQRSGLFGHSLAGSFVLDMLFQRSPLLKSYIAASPGIFWNDAELLQTEEQYRMRVAPRQLAQLLICVGGNEQELPPAEERRISLFLEQHPELSAGMSLESARQMFRDRRMVDYAREMTDRLSSVMPARFFNFADENHISVVPAAISRAVNFLTDEPLA